MRRLLHIIPSLGPGGAARSLVSLVGHARQLRPMVEHVVAALDPGGYMPLLFQLRRQSCDVLSAPGRDRLVEEIAAADLVLLHFWNAPQLWRRIAEDLPPARYLLWSKVRGADPPQRLSRALLGGCVAVIGTAPLPGALADAFPDADVVPGLADWSRLSNLRPAAHDGFNIDYLGTVSLGKIHPRFVEMMRRLAMPGIRIRIFGGVPDAAMQAAIAASPRPDIFHCGGFVEDIGSVLSTSDLFAYPLADTTYGGSDKSLQEAMYAGVPPIVLAGRGPSNFVTHGHDGIVAEDEDGFVAAVEHLYRRPEERRRLGGNARATAIARFDPARHAARLLDIADRAAGADPRRLIAWSAPDRSAGLLFLLSQDWDEAEARAALAAWSGGQASPLDDFAAGLDDGAFQVEGGLLHWRKQAMDDPLIRSLAAFWLDHQGRREEAQEERLAAIGLGAPPAAFRGLAV